MDLNGLRTALSLLSLIALVLALVLYFTNTNHAVTGWIVAAIVLKAAELVIRIIQKHRKNKEEYGYYDK